ncbi:MAG: glucan biosynthesis protein [Rhodospirillales bacterium]|nr:glucan biosynthesis protein [Rhodospirillales bacterium]
MTVAGFKMKGGVARFWLVAVMAAFASAALPARAAAQSFGFADVAQRAQALAAEAYVPHAGEIPNALKQLNYDDFRNIRFRKEQALWRDQRLFEVQFFHLGFLYQVPVRINIVSPDGVVRVPFRKEMFVYENVEVPENLSEDIGFAGFRVHYPLHTPDYKDEIAVFLGASYFRVLGREQRFGTSARGLAVDTAMPSGEEFPDFREFWLVEPEPQSTELTIYALLDSPSVTGAYEFRIQPGNETVVEVRSQVHIREAVDKLGVAPLTSMFFFGENVLRWFDDYRPEVHDADGLLTLTGNREWIWRPLTNPRELRVSSFQDQAPKGFGLMQRDRDFSDYLDLEAEYHQRPSMWIEPIGDWGQGAVELIEIPTEDETNDNIVVFWVPKRPAQKGDIFEHRYRLFAQLQNPYRPPLARTVRTRIGSPAVAGSKEAFPKDTRLFVVDFEGGGLNRLSSEHPVEAEITNNVGRVFDGILLQNKQTNGWRVAFRLDPDGEEAVDLKLQLKLRGRPISESWTYLWTPSLVGR